MTERSFLDTNVLVYVFDRAAPAKRVRAREILADAAQSGLGVVSTQVLQEFYVAVTRKLARPLSHSDAESAVRGLGELPLATVGLSTVLAAVRRAGDEPLSLWDALIVQAALESGCRCLLTEDLQHGRVFDGLRVADPFRD